MLAYENWIVAEESHVATLSLNRAEAGNSLDTETLIELGEISKALESRGDIWSVVLKSEGNHFSTGFEPGLIRSGLEASEASIRAMIASHHACLDSFEKIEKPTIAAIRGFCIGGGLILALCCDFRIASERTVFSLPEVRLGLPILWGTHRIVRVVGTAKAKQLIMLGGRFKAEEAKGIGLVHNVVKDEELDSAVDALLSNLHKSPPRTQGIAKRLINNSMEPVYCGTEELELEAIAELRGSPDLSEALDSYFERRTPHYSGE
ncbi:MAG: enoyl-CoA hydratase/isomerase family protein [Candidatus Promineifilaceae bacterium]